MNDTAEAKTSQAPEIAFPTPRPGDGNPFSRLRILILKKYYINFKLTIDAINYFFSIIPTTIEDISNIKVGYIP